MGPRSLSAPGYGAGETRDSGVQFAAHQAKGEVAPLVAKN